MAGKLSGGHRINSRDKAAMNRAAAKAGRLEEITVVSSGQQTTSDVCSIEPREGILDKSIFMRK
jgi:hypothetical protein